MGNNLPHQQGPEKMENNNRSGPVEEDPTEKRKASASVDELRDLYSALQGLVPSTNQLPSSGAILEKTGTSDYNCKENSDAPQSSAKQNPAPSIPAKRSSSPLPSRTEPRIVRRNRSNSLDALIGFPSLSEQTLRRRDSICGYSHRKRLLRKSKRMQEELFTIIKDFDEADINCGRERSQSLDTLLETTASSAAEATCSRRQSLTTVSQRKNLLDRLTICETDREALENTNHISVEKDLKSEFSGNEDDGSNFVVGKKRLSAGDIFERQRSRLDDPRTAYRRRSIGGSLLLNAIASSTSTSLKRKDSLASALSLIAHKNELQELIKNCRDKITTGEQEHKGSDETDSGNSNPESPTTAKTTQTGTNRDALQKEVDILLASIEELQQDSENYSHDQDSLKDLETIRRASVGTEMHNLLEALRELIVSGDTTPCSTPSGSTTSSRRPSITDIRPALQTESLEELEAYFNTKLEDICEGDTDKVSSPVGVSTSSKEIRKPRGNSQEKRPLNSSRRLSASNAGDKVKSANAPVSMTTSLPESSSFVDLLKQGDAFDAQRQRTTTELVQHVGSRVARRRSQSAHDIELPVTTMTNEVTINRSTYSYGRSRGRDSEISEPQQNKIANIDPVDVQNRALWKEDQLMFADQVNKRLQDWLERATALSLQEGQMKEEDHAPKKNFLIVVNSCSSDNEADCKTKKSHSRFAMKKVLRKKVKRSKSINNLNEAEKEHQQKSPRFKRGNRNKVKRSKSMHSILDQEELQTKPKSKSHMFRSPQNLLRIGRQRLLRSKSVHKLSKESQSKTTRESDESFDDNHSPFSIRRNLSCDSSEPNRSTENLEANSDNVESEPTFPGRSSCIIKKTNKNSNIPTPFQGAEKNTRSYVNGKRTSSLFPMNLPLFYSPGNDAPTLHTKDESEVIKRSNARKCLLFGKSEAKRRLFYEQTQMPAIALQMQSAFPFPRIIAGSSTETNISPGSVTDEGYIRSPSQEGLNDSSSASPDFADFRDRAKSTESEDSGCPNLSDIYFCYTMKKQVHVTRLSDHVVFRASEDL